MSTVPAKSKQARSLPPKTYWLPPGRRLPPWSTVHTQCHQSPPNPSHKSISIFETDEHKRIATLSFPISHMNCLERAKKNSTENIGTNKSNKATSVILFSLLSISLPTDLMLPPYFGAVENIIFLFAHFPPIVCVKYLVVVSLH